MILILLIYLLSNILPPKADMKGWSQGKGKAGLYASGKKSAITKRAIVMNTVKSPTFSCDELSY